MRPMGLGKKSPVYGDPCMAWLMQLSKAALADCVVDLLRGGSGTVDDPVAEITAMDRLKPVLILRNDRIPETEGSRDLKRTKRRRAQQVFAKAVAIANRK